MASSPASLTSELPGPVSGGGVAPPSGSGACLVVGKSASQRPGAPLGDHPAEDPALPSRIGRGGGEAGGHSGADVGVSIRADLLRATALSFTLSHLGWCWRLCQKGGILTTISPEAAELLHRKSQVVKRIDAFLSHSWKSGASGKYLSLLCLSGWKIALAGFVVGLIASVTLTLSGWVMLGKVYHDIPVVHYSFPAAWGLNIWLPNAMASICLLASPYIRAVKGDSPKVFLDCVCIDQVNNERKSEGISSLAGFLNNSEQLWILWSPHYLTRLWCVYELATFTDLHSDRPVHMILPFQYVGMLLFSWGLTLLMAGSSAYLSSTCTEPGSCQYTSTFALVVLLVIPFGVCLRAFIRSAAGIDGQLSRFDCSEAECWDPVDRDFIHDEIVLCHGSLAGFNDFVRGPLRRQVIAMSSSTSWPPYFMALVMASAWLCYNVDIMIGSVRSSLPLIYRPMIVIGRSTDALCFGPLCVRLLVFLFGVSVQWRSYTSEFAKVCIITILACLGMYFYLWMLMASLLHFAATIAYCIVGMMLTWFVFFRQRVPCRGRGRTA